MSGLASTILSGDAAYLVAIQAELLTSSGGRDIYRLKTPDLRIGVYDNGTRRLVIFDGAALAALAVTEVADVPPAETSNHTIAQGGERKTFPRAVHTIDPPDRL